MNTIIENFRESIVLKVFIGFMTLLLTSLSGNNYNKQQEDSTFTLVDEMLQKKILEIDNAYFNAYKTIE